MNPESKLPANITFHPLTPDRWSDLEGLFGERGATGGCWCMWWRHVSRADFDAQKGDGNKAAFKQLVESGSVPGILAYVDEQAVGWCSVAPRDTYPGLARSRILKPVDEQPVWSITCFFVAKPHRQKGLTRAMLLAAIAYAREQGAAVLEGYPVEPKTANTPAVFAWTGLASAFQKTGFVEAARRSETRPIMRYFLPEEH